MNTQSIAASECAVQLFITGDSDQTRAVCKRVSDFAATTLKQAQRIDIIDVLDEPGLADSANVFVTPTLVIRTPNWERRLVGDLSDVAKLERVLADAEAR
jgi:circadian clock protein KaiB